jgi:DNA-binding transcriptional ArsR family regulator
MESSLAIKRLSALAQDGRLAAFRLLVRAGSDGMAAGDVARELGVPANTLSAQLGILTNAGLIAGRREGRSVLYAANYDGMTELIAFLMDDCCGGRPELCAPLVEIATRVASCAPSATSRSCC